MMARFDRVSFIGPVYFLFFPCSFTGAPLKATYSVKEDSLLGYNRNIL